jgi:tetratricopeptide (TPR) repeat protein
LALVAIPAAAGQAADPKTDFVQALARFSLGLEGTYGDEGSRIRSSLDSMDQELERWDATIRTYEMAMASEVNGAEPQVAARLHAALGGVYLDRTYARLGRGDEARAEFEVVLMLNPNHSEAYAALAQVHLTDGQYAEAAETARRALALNPAQQQARYALATSLMRLGKTDEGKQELAVFERLQTEAAAARSREIELDGIRGDAVVSSANGDHEKAIVLLRKALQLAPDAASSHLDLGNALAKAAQHAEAIERYKSAVILNADVVVHRKLAESYAALGQLEESRREQALYERLKQESLAREGSNR